MKVLEIIATLDLGGAERALAQRLRYQPDTTESVLMHGPPRTATQVQLPSNVRTIVGKITRRSIADAIGIENPDVIVLHDPRNLLRTHFPRLESLPSCTVFVMHGSFISESRFKSFLLKIPFRIAVSRASRVVAVSRRAADALKTTRPVTVIHLGPIVEDSIGQVDHVDRFRWLERAELRLLVLSRMTSAKNIDSLIRAIVRIRSEFESRSARLLIVGDGPQKERLTRIVERYRLGSLVGFSATTRTPTAFMSLADYLVVASSNEGGPLTVFEALRCGTRVVATRVGVVDELASLHPDQFVLASSPSPRSLQTALLQALARGPVTRDEGSISPRTETDLDARTQSEFFYSVLTGRTS